MNRSLAVIVVVLQSCQPSDPGPDGGFGGGSPLGTGGGTPFFADGGGSCLGGGTAGAAGSFDGPVVTPARQPPPISGGTLAVLGDDTVVAADADRDEVWLLPAGTMTPVRIDLGDGDEPGRVVEGPPGRAFVALRGVGKVAELDVAGRRVAALHDACPDPRGLAWLAARSTLAVACANGELARLRFDAGALVETTRRFIADDLRDVVPHGADVAVSTFRRAEVHLLDAQGNPASVLPLDVIDATQAQVAWRMIPTSKGPLVLFQQHSLSSLSTACGASYGQGGFSATRPVTATLTRADAIIALPNLTLAVDVALASDGKSAAVVAPGSRTVVQVDLDSRSPGITYGDGQWQPVAAAYRGTTLVVQSREPAALHLIGAITQVVPLSSVSRRGTGHDLFHLATPAGIACASCHPEAGDDGHVWQLPEGTRRTPTLRGGLSATAPFHWGGEFPAMEQLVSEIMVRRMGGQPQTPQQVSALLGWLDSVPKVAPPPVDAAAASRGATLFSGTAGCAACHAGPLGTNNLTVSVGTGQPLQVPRLVELSARAPYFHDGRVPTLAARFSPLGGEAHGSTSTLTPPQIDDLIAYLRTR